MQLAEEQVLVVNIKWEFSERNITGVGPDFHCLILANVTF